MSNRSTDVVYIQSDIAMTIRTTTLFISHASEDKEDFVRPLAHALKKRGLKVWYDEFSLKIGDSLRRSIDRGLADCTAGVVVLSKSFFAKEWPQRELDALYSAEIAGRSRILPIWHCIDFKSVADISPLLADRLAISSSKGVDVVAAEIAAQFPAAAKHSGEDLALQLREHLVSGIFPIEARAAGCRYRFLLLNAFKEEYCNIADEAMSGMSDDELEEFPSELERRLDQDGERLRIKYGIPEDVYLIPDEPVRESHLPSFLADIEEWSSGTLSKKRSAKLVLDLDYAELDEYFILLGLPNFSFSHEQRKFLEKAIVEVGCGFKQEYRKLESICEKLERLGRDIY